MTKTTEKKNSRKGKAAFSTDRRRKHHHFLVSVYYADGEKFGRVYTDKGKATRFAERQRGGKVSPYHTGVLIVPGMVFGISMAKAGTACRCCPAML